MATAALLVVAAVFAPHHLFAQGVEEVGVLYLHDANAVGGAAQRQRHVVGETLATAVDGDKEIVAAAAHTHGDFHLVADDNGARVEAVRGHGRYAQRGRRGLHRLRPWR